MHSERQILTCVDGIYVAIFPQMNMVFTESASDAQAVASSMGSYQKPYWWTQRFKVNEANRAVWQRNISELEAALGKGGFSSFYRTEISPATRAVTRIMLSGYVFCL